MRYLVDTNVISDARRPDSAAAAWLRTVRASDTCLSVITIGEVVQGVAYRRRRDPAASDVIDRWLADTRQRYRQRILPVSDAVATVWGELASHRSRRVADALIAATALVHDLVLVSRNVRDFEDAGVRLLNPWSLG